MSTWLNVATGTTCTIVTIIGLLLSVWAWRAKGWRSGMRGIAWSLLPVVMYLTGAIRLVGRLGSAIVVFAGNFVFSPKTWLGVILFFVAAALFLATGGIPLVQRGRKRQKRREARQRSGETAAAPSQIPAAPAESHLPQPDDDLGDVEEILRRRGIK
jgi:cytochrome c oxidase assembly factor CtaG